MNEPWINNPVRIGDTLVSVIGVLGLVMAICRAPAHTKRKSKEPRFRC